MYILSIFKKNVFQRFIFLLFLLFIYQSFSQGNNEKKSLNNLENKSLSIETNYILGEGDVLSIKYYGLNIFDGIYPLDIDGKLNLPELGRLKASGYTIDELETFLEKKYSSVINNPDLDIEVIKYRPIGVFISGEVNKPGLYIFKDNKQPVQTNIVASPEGQIQTLISQRSLNLDNIYEKINNDPRGNNTFSFIPIRLFDVIKRAEGITNYGDLSQIEVIRNNSISNGGGKIKTTIDFVKLLKDGDQSQNITIYDGDSIFISKSERILKEQVLLATNSNLTPNTITVFITGNVSRRGSAVVFKGSSLNQAIASAGGKKQFTGKVEFIRFEKDGVSKKRIFKYNPDAQVNSEKNPILTNGDIINVRKTLLGKTSGLLNEISNPLITGYGIYSIFN